MKTVGYYDALFEAEMARGLLESEGIEAIVLNENTSSVLPFGDAIASLRPYVVVADEDLERARELLGL
jgi:hypothetical protein